MDRVNATACIDCAVGKFAGTVGLTACVDCAVGKYQSTVGSSVCLDCPAGKARSAQGAIDLTDCLDCSAGKYAADDGTKECHNCVAGSFAGATGATTCPKCAAGKWALDGSSECTPCQPNSEGSSTTVEKGRGMSAASCYRACDRGKKSDYNAFQCTDCGAGTFNNQSGMPVCTPCLPGTYQNRLGGTQCFECEEGKFAALEGSPECQLCAAGRYNILSKAESEDSCEACPAGYYSIPGSTACRLVPPGSCAPTVATTDFVYCEAGWYQPTEGKTSCLVTQSGHYTEKGAAVQMPCPAGRYNGVNGSASVEACHLCLAGRYSSSGSSACSTCEPGSYSSKEGTKDKCNLCSTSTFSVGFGSTQCSSCDEGYVSNSEGTGCIVDVNSLSTANIKETIYNKGYGLYGMCAIAVAFVAVAGLMSFKMGKEADLARLERAKVVIKSFAPGLSFGSEVFLIIGMMIELPSLAIVMFVFRSLHFLGCLSLVIVIFGPLHVAQGMERVIPGASTLRDSLNVQFSVANIPFVGILLILCMFDVTMLQFLPWKQSRFHVESQGYPAIGMMQFCLGIKTLQSSVSVVCQLCFLVLKGGLNDPMTSVQAKSLFTLNILFSLVTVTLGILVLYQKWDVLKHLNDEAKSASASSKEESVPSDSHSFQNDNDDSLGGFMFENPLHAVSNNTPSNSTDNFLETQLEEIESIIEQVKGEIQRIDNDLLGK